MQGSHDMEEIMHKIKPYLKEDTNTNAFNYNRTWEAIQEWKNRRAAPAEGLVALSEQELLKDAIAFNKEIGVKIDSTQETMLKHFCRFMVGKYGAPKQDPLASVNGLLEALDFAKAAIGDAIYCEDGLDGSAGEAMIKMIDGAVKNYKESKPQGIGVDWDKFRQVGKDYFGYNDIDFPCSVLGHGDFYDYLKSRQNEWLINNPNHSQQKGLMMYENKKKRD